MNHLLPGRLAVVFSHHPHEIFATGLLLQFKPDVLFLSHAHGERNLEAQARRGLEAIGFEGTVRFLPLSERTACARMIDHDFDWFRDMRDQVAGWLVEKCPDTVLSDGYEGYNPIHDLSSLMVDSAIFELQRERKGWMPQRFEMPLAFGAKPGGRLPGTSDPGQRVFACVLSEQQVQMKRHRCNLLLRELPVDNSVADHPATVVSGIHPTLFEKEFYCPVPPDRSYCRRPSPGNWKTYDQHGRERVASGRFATALTFADHYAPMARELFRSRCPSTAVARSA